MGQRSKQLREELRTCDDVEVRLVNYGHCWSQVITETELITEKHKRSFMLFTGWTAGGALSPAEADTALLCSCERPPDPEWP